MHRNQGISRHSHYSNVIRAVRHFQSLTTQLFVQQLVQANTKGPHYWPIVWGEFTSHWWFPLTQRASNVENISMSGCQLDMALRWRHNKRDGISNHQPHDCVLNRLFRHKSKKTSKLCVTGLCEGNSPVTGQFPSQRASKAENVSIWWRHHGPSLNGIFWNLHGKG